MPSVSGIEPLPKPPQCVLCHIHAKAGIVKCHAPQAEGLSHVANVHILAGPKGSKSLLEHLPHFPGCVAELFQCQLHLTWGIYGGRRSTGGKHTAEGTPLTEQGQLDGLPNPVVLVLSRSRRENSAFFSSAM